LKKALDSGNMAKQLNRSSKFNTEQERLAQVQALFACEQDLYDAGAKVIVCIDEVGRGALAGPVSAAAVVLGPDWQPVLGLRDSKQISAKQREELAVALTDNVQAWHVAHVDAGYIDEHGIVPALRRAMLCAVEGLQLDYAPDKVLIDGLPMKLFEQEIAIVKGDSKVAGIAAASILAKVARDALMVAADADYGGYGFVSNKGYGSIAHRTAIVQQGLSSIHRRSFCQKILESGNQEELF